MERWGLGELGGTHARLVRAWREGLGAGDGTWADAASLRDLPWEATRRVGAAAADALFVALLMADVAQALRPADRAAFVSGAASRLAAGVGADELMTYLRMRAGQRRGVIVPASARVGVVGPLGLASDDDLAGGVWGALESRGIMLSRMPVAECLWCIWSGTVKDADDTPGALADASDDERGRAAAALDHWGAWLYDISLMLGQATPFEEGPQELAARAAVSEALDAVGRYCRAKLELARACRAGVVALGEGWADDLCGEDGAGCDSAGPDGAALAPVVLLGSGELELAAALDALAPLLP